MSDEEHDYSSDSEEFLGSINEGAITHHELYQAWMDAGFPEERAFELVKTMIIETVRRGAE